MGYVYKKDGREIGKNVHRRAKVITELLQRDDIQNKTNTWDDNSKYGTPSNDISSYDDYFDAADRKDRVKRMKLEGTKSTSNDNANDASPNKKKKKKKKKKKDKKK